LFKGYGAKVGLGNMRVKAENRMVTVCQINSIIYIFHNYYMPYFKKNNDLTATHKITFFFNKYAKMERNYLCISLFF
jgi:hypothetical protein